MKLVFKSRTDRASALNEEWTWYGSTLVHARTWNSSMQMDEPLTDISIYMGQPPKPLKEVLEQEDP